MKKWIAIPLVIALLSFGSTTMAKSEHGKQNKNSHDADVENCGKIPPGLINALKKEKNSKAKAAIEKNIEKHKQKCKKDENENNNENDNVWTDLQRVLADKAALQIGFGSNDSAQSVTGPIQLAAVGKKGSVITWSSNKPNVISNNGLTVVRPTAMDETVVLTATITVNQVIESKTFNLLIKALSIVSTDAQKVATDKEVLQISFNGTDTANSVTQALAALPSKGLNGSTITWYSGFPSVISNDGKTIIRPIAGKGDVVVLMIASVVSNTVSDAKIFQLTIKQQLTDNQKVAADKAALEINFGGSDTLTRVTRPVDQLPANGVNGSQITWTSGSTSIFSSDGKTINRPAQGAGDAAVLINAIITSNSVTDVKVFTLIVKQEFTNLEKVAADKADLVITFGESDLATQVTKPLSLPTVGYYGSTMIWLSSNPLIISNNGTVINRPAHGSGDAAVTFSAYISNNGIVDLKTFQVIVKQL
ncbi:MAG: immunoglobulin-like domain-containing protein [Paenibacillaceae bacterium]